MISYERIDCSEGIDLNKSKDSGNLSTSSVKFMICCYYYFKDIGFKYQPYVCNGCHDFYITVQVLFDFFILIIKGANYRVYIANFDKKDAVNILNSSNLSNRGVV